MKKHHWILLFFVLSTIVIRLLFAFQTPHFANEESYFILRQVDHITETGLPITYDPLAGDKQIIISPVYYYILAFFNLILPISIVGKILPNLFASLLTVIGYLIGKEMTNSTKVGLFSAFIVSFIPIYFTQTLNTISPYSLVIPLMFFTLFCLMRLHKDKRFATCFVISTAILAFTHISSIIFVVSILLYLLLIKMDKLSQSKHDTEVIVFSTVFIFWAQTIVYKQALLLHGLSIFWQNIPQYFVGYYFADLSILQALYQIGILPVIFGVWVIYKSAFRMKNYNLYLLTAFALSVTFMLWLKFIPLKVGVMFLGVVLTLTFGQYFQSLLQYFKKTRAASMQTWAVLAFIFLFIITSFLPTIQTASGSISSSVGDDYIASMKSLEMLTDTQSLILTVPEEGNLITYISNRSVLLDTNYLMDKKIDQKTDDLIRIYNTRSSTEAIKLLNKYEITHILISPASQRIMDSETLHYVNDQCFKAQRTNLFTIYRSVCILEDIK